MIDCAMGRCAYNARSSSPWPAAINKAEPRLQENPTQSTYVHPAIRSPGSCNIGGSSLVSGVCVNFRYGCCLYTSASRPILYPRSKPSTPCPSFSQALFLPCSPVSVPFLCAVSLSISPCVDIEVIVNSTYGHLIKCCVVYALRPFTG